MDGARDCIAFLANGPRRFNELKRLIGGITQRMRTITLRQLERERLVTRTMYPTIPPRVEYELTELGRSLREPIQMLGAWVVRNQAALAEARKRFDAVETTWRRIGRLLNAFSCPAPL